MMPDCRPTLLLINFHAGRFADGAAVGHVLDELTRGGTEEVLVRQTPAELTGDLDWIRPERYRRIVIMGGDGSLNNVINAFAAHGPLPPMALIPAGTTSDFARSLGLPLGNYRGAARVARDGEPSFLDLGRINRRFFSYIACFGAFVTVASDTPRELKRTLGHLAYMIEGLRSVLAVQPIRTRIHHEGTVYEESLLFGAIANTTSIGGLLRLPAAQVDLSDGEFEALFVRAPANPLEVPAILNTVLAGRLDDRNLLFFTASKLELEFDEPVDFVADGEAVGKLDSVCIQNLHRALPFILPARSRS
ncbi:MAG: YegS/Rv2252/BmrU family lipid kinase [Bacillota bacterium]|nr:YegS/Rv2252/BmrU family lipid kinase [Bacillota bacterium]